MNIRINVTQRDIDQGCRASVRSCPIARALSRHLPKFPGCDYVSAFPNLLTLGQAFWYARTPPSASAFILAFDSTEPVRPFSFVAEFEEVGK